MKTEEQKDKYYEAVANVGGPTKFERVKTFVKENKFLVGVTIGIIAMNAVGYAVGKHYEGTCGLANEELADDDWGDWAAEDNNESEDQDKPAE